MATTTSNGHARTVDDAPRVIQRIHGQPRRPTHVVPRLVGMGMPVDEAMQLADQHDEQRIVDALDAVEEFGVTSRIINPVGWVRAAVRREWDLTGVLAERRENERRLAVLDADRAGAGGRPRRLPGMAGDLGAMGPSDLRSARR